jgi:HD-like signal output (HDOD) protein
MISTSAACQSSEPAGQLTVSRICAGLESRMVPMVGQILQIIKDISGRAEIMPVSELVEFINGEPTTLGRIVSIASSVGHNPSGTEITSAHHAISLIGFDRIRTLAISILLMETAQSRYTAEANRELAAMSLTGGMVAAELCRRAVPADPEMAFICGALRGYGRMLAATFLPEQYAEVLQLAARSGFDQAFILVFGLSPIQLGNDLMVQMKLPKAVISTMAELTPHERRHASSNPVVALRAAADFGVRFAELLQEPDLNIHNYEERIERLSAEYDVEFQLSRSRIKDLLLHLVGVLESFRYRADSYVGSVATFRRLHCLVAERVLPTPFGSEKDQPSTRVPVSPPHESPDYAI